MDRADAHGRRMERVQQLLQAPHLSPVLGHDKQCLARRDHAAAERIGDGLADFELALLAGVDVGRVDLAISGLESRQRSRPRRADSEAVRAKAHPWHEHRAARERGAVCESLHLWRTRRPEGRSIKARPLARRLAPLLHESALHRPTDRARRKVPRGDCPPFSLGSLGSWVLGSCAASLRRSSSGPVLALSCSSGHLNAHVPLEQLLSASASLALLQITMSSAAVPDPDAEVPKEVRDEFFKQMKSKQSERVRRGASANMPRPAYPRAHR